MNSMSLEDSINIPHMQICTSQCLIKILTILWNTTTIDNYQYLINLPNIGLIEFNFINKKSIERNKFY